MLNQRWGCGRGGRGVCSEQALCPLEACPGASAQLWLSAWLRTRPSRPFRPSRWGQWLRRPPSVCPTWLLSSPRSGLPGFRPPSLGGGCEVQGGQTVRDGGAGGESRLQNPPSQLPTSLLLSSQLWAELLDGPDIPLV